MDKLCIVVWFVTLITFVVFFFKKRKARKVAGENYKQDEQYLKVSKKKKIIGWVCILSFIGSICFAPDHPKQELTPEQIQAQQAKKEEAKAKKEAEKAEKEAEAKAKKEAEDKAKQEEKAKKQADFMIAQADTYSRETRREADAYWQQVSERVRALHQDPENLQQIPCREKDHT